MDNYKIWGGYTDGDMHMSPNLAIGVMGGLPQYILEVRPSCVGANQANWRGGGKYRREGQTRQRVQ